MEVNSKEIKDKKGKSNFVLQDYLSLGYIFLLIIGIFHQTIYYKFIGINILEYSSVLDVLISPVSVITGDLFLGLAIVFAVVFALLYKFLLPKHYKYLAKKEKYQSGKNKLKLDKAIAAVQSNGFTIFMIGLMIFSVFVGLGVGRGAKISEGITENDIKHTHELVFEDGEAKKIKMLGKNSLYVFYIIKGEQIVSIAPIDGNIKVIKKLK